MLSIRHLLRIDAPPARVYRAISEQAGLRGWWTPAASATPEVGSIAEFRFGLCYHNRKKVIRLEPGSAVEWLCPDGNAEWIGTTFLFELEPDSKHTILRFTHGNWREMTDFFASCNYQWAYYLRSLKAFCETGRGTPHREPTE